jgi:tetratricopeptide (TPR) repeat protein/predicted Ser/Thr protein kinase
MPPSERCPENAVLSAFVRGRLSASDRRVLDEHLDGCPACRRTAVGMLSHAGSAPPAGASSLSPAADELQPGDKVGRHIVVGRLGAGGMGTVYAAYDTALERKIALKFLSRAGAGGADGARLVEEASAMARLQHPNVVTVHDVGMWDGQPYLAMEYVKGQTLDEWRGQRPRRPREILEVMAAVARGLEAAHAAGIVHRDVKPHNVLVAEGRVLVTDFGLSVRDQQGLEGAGPAAGTPLYMAPEQFAGSASTPATDVFGFCVTLYELLYGQHPFAGGAGAGDLRARVLAGELRPPPPGKGVPRHVQRLMLAGLSVDPAARPQGMGAIATALLHDPARRRRRVGALVLGAGAVAGAFWVGGYVKADPGRRCQAGAAVMDTLWSAQRRQQLGAARQGAAAATWQTLARRFDDYAGAWRDMFTGTCRAAFSERRISGELFDLRMDCLDSQRASFAAVLGSLPAASAAQLQSVAASPLPPVAACGITERLSAQPLPADPASRARVARINEKLAQLDAARTLGDFTRARQLATEAVADARSLGYAPLEARAINKLAAVELRGIKRADSPTGKPATLAADRAMALLQQAIAVAEAGRDDASRAEAATQLVLAHRDAGRLPEAERWAELASAIIQRIGDPPLYRSSLDMARGWVLYDRDQWDAAGASFGRALRLRQQLLGPRAPEVLAAKNATCGAMPMDKRIQCERETLALALAVGGPRHPDVATIKAALAYILVDDDAHRDEACQLATEAIELERSAVEANHIGLLRAMLALAQCRRDQGRIEEARRVYLDAIAYATHPTGLRGDLLMDYGVFVGMRGDYPQSIAWMRKAVADYEVVYGPTQHKTIETRQRIADRLRRQGKLQAALKEADEAIAICDKAGAMPVTYPELYQVKGLTLLDMKKLEPAQQLLLRAVELHEKVKTPERNRAFTFATLGEVEAGLGKVEQGVAHLEKAMTMWTLEADPVYHGAVALIAANAVAKQGRAAWPRACEFARRALTGYSQPFGQSMADAIAATKKFLTAHRCDGNS